MTNGGVPPRSAGSNLARRMSQRLWAALLLLLLGASAQGQEKQKKLPLEIPREGSLKIGLPGSSAGTRCRVGVWNPVYVLLRAGDDPIGARQYQLVVETSDSDENQNQYFTDVPALTAGQEQWVMTYVRPGNLNAPITVTLLKDGSPVHPARRAPQNLDILEPQNLLYVTLGPRLPALWTAFKNQSQNKPVHIDPELGPEPDDGRESIRRYGFIDRVEQMPDRWYGYGAVDVLFLASGSKFIEELYNQAELEREGTGRAHALAEWVRRGGRLVITAGRNQQTVQKLLDRLRLLDCKFSGRRSVRSLPELQLWVGYNKDPLPAMEITTLEPGPGVDALVTVSKGAQGKEAPVIVVAPCGLGRVLLLGFDVEAPPFTQWPGLTKFWEKIDAEIRPRLPASATSPQSAQRFQSGNAPHEMAKDLQTNLESFEEVPVISFGWVALFIFLYILIVGPLDYFLLKKVFKRLELTWITFPSVVIIISVTAYFTAYKLKGNDLRMNKLDVVDLDLRGGQINGTTWFTLFNPRIQNYSIGIVPAPGWAPQKPDPLTDYAPLVGTLSPPDSSQGGMNRNSGSGSFFRRPYEYASNAAALRNVPIPVWAPRSFTGSWYLKLKQGESAPFEAELRPTRSGEFLEGTLVNHLPVELQEVWLHYQGKWYAIPANLPSNQPFRIDSLNVRTRPGGSDTSSWLGQDFRYFQRAPGGTSSAASRRPSRPMPSEDGVYSLGTTPAALMKSIFFYGHDGAPRSSMNNSGLRTLDQGWRLKPLNPVLPSGQVVQRRYLDEVVLVARVMVPSGEAEQVNSHGAAATQLWLGHLPGDPRGRETLNGKLSQETFVRVFIPVQTREP